MGIIDKIKCLDKILDSLRFSSLVPIKYQTLWLHKKLIYCFRLVDFNIQLLYSCGKQRYKAKHNNLKPFTHGVFYNFRSLWEQAYAKIEKVQRKKKAMACESDLRCSMLVWIVRLSELTFSIWTVKMLLCIKHKIINYRKKVQVSWNMYQTCI